MMEILLIAVALAMDCFAVSVVCGMITRRKDWTLMFRLAFLFGFYQAMMPLAGWFLTSRFSEVLESVDHWIAFAMLAFIGIKMVRDAFNEEEGESIDPTSSRTRHLLAIATSIDALAVGISFACTGYRTLGQLTIPLSTIGLVSFLFSLTGFALGARYGDTINKKVRPELLGGIILIAIGVKILLEHLLG